MNVLIDTSVWIEYFRKGVGFHVVSLLHDLIEKDVIVTCRLVRAEIFSGTFPTGRIGKPTYTRRLVAGMFDHFPCIDPDWNDPVNWDEISAMAGYCRAQGMKIPGIVDRMIILAATRAQCSVWSLDRVLTALAVGKGVACL